MKTKQLLSKTLCTAMFAGALLFGSSSVFAQVKIGTNPTTINAANNLEVEASTAGNKVSVDKTTGKVTIADGSQGAAKVLTSDANGVATWSLPATQNADVMVSVGIATPQIINTVGAGQTLDLSTSTFDKGSNFNLSTNGFTAPSTGYYQFNLLVNSSVAAGIITGRFGFLIINGVNVRTLYNQRVEAIDGYSVYSGALLKLNAGDVLSVKLGSADGASYPLSGGFLEIHKISN